MYEIKYIHYIARARGRDLQASLDGVDRKQDCNRCAPRRTTCSSTEGKSIHLYGGKKEKKNGCASRRSSCSSNAVKQQSSRMQMLLLAENLLLRTTYYY